MLPDPPALFIAQYTAERTVCYDEDALIPQKTNNPHEYTQTNSTGARRTCVSAEAIERFVAVVGCRPKLVMDRGFACPFIIEYLAAVGHPFIVRIQSMKTLTMAERRLIFQAKAAPNNDQRITVYWHQLRLVVSDKPGNGHEPWYLITNDVISVRGGIC